MLVAQSAAGKDHRSKSGIPEMNREARRDQFRLSRLQRERCIDTRTQIESCGPGGCVAGQVVPHALVEHLDIDRGHGTIPDGGAVRRPPEFAERAVECRGHGSAAGGIQLGDVPHQEASLFGFRGMGQHVSSMVVEEHQFAGLGSDGRLRQIGGE